MGVNIIGVFLGALIATIFCGELLWSSLLAFAALLICGFDTGSGLLTQWFGNTTIQQLLWVMAFGAAVSESGAVGVIARKILRIRALKGHPMRIVLGLYLGILCCSMLVSSQTVLMTLFYPLLDEVCDICEIKNDSDLKRALNLGIWISTMGGYIFPFKGLQLTGLAVMKSVMTEKGVDFNGGVFFGAGIIIVFAVVLVYVLLLMRVVWKLDMTPLKKFDPDKMSGDRNEKMTRKQIVLLGALLFAIAFICASSLLPSGNVVQAFTSKIGNVWIWIILFALLCIVRDKEGKPYIEGVRILKTKAMWAILATAGCFTILGTAISADEYGISAAIVTLLTPLFSNLNWVFMVILSTAIMLIFTNFTNGMPISSLLVHSFIPFACIMCAEGKISALSVTLVCVVISIGAKYAFLTNSASATAPLLQQRDGMTNKFMFTKGLVTVFSIIAVISLVCIVMGYIL